MNYALCLSFGLSTKISHFVLQKVILTHPQAIKALSPGRVVVIDNHHYRNTLAFVLKADTSSRSGKRYVVLIMCEQKQEWPELQAANSSDSLHSNADNEYLMPRPYASELFRPEGVCGHEVITVSSDDISCVTTTSSKIAADKILDDFKKRQIPRFKWVLHLLPHYT